MELISFLKSILIHKTNRIGYLRYYSISVLVPSLILFSCGSNGKQTEENNSMKDSVKSILADRLSGDSFYLSKRSLPAFHLIGKNVSGKYTDLTASLKKELPQVLQLVNSNKKTLTGPFYIIHKVMPKSSEESSFFIGIAVNNTDGIQANNKLELPASDFYLFESMNEMGMGLNSFEKAENILKQNKITFQYPIIETFKESKNTEMVSSLNHQLIYYKIQ